MDYVPTLFAYNKSQDSVGFPTRGASERTERLKKKKLSYPQERSIRRKVQLCSDDLCERPLCNESTRSSSDETGLSNEEPGLINREPGRSSQLEC